MDFSKNLIKKLSPNLSNLTKLESLLLNNNELRKLPYGFDNLNALVELNLSNNQFDTIPEGLYNLTNLQRLSFSGNQIKIISQNIEKLKNLESLDLSDNKLSTLPTVLNNLNLKELCLDKNSLPPELRASYNQGLKTLFRYLKEQEKSEVIINEAKLIFVGEGEVGKTCLLGALRGDPLVGK